MHTIGRYQLLERLGQGGMGVVYRAHDTLLERTVAVKMISAPIDQNADLRERFFREARSAGQLSHRNIITIHDLGEHEGQPYLAMEFLEGHDLQERMVSPQKLSVRRKLDIAIDICEGLDYAHVHGVIHRDIKPANVFVTDGGMVKILDFGLARLVTSELTRSNMMMGTLNYMAPEQIRGERVDHRVDIFSAGVVLYELFGGKRAFEGDSFASTLYKILQESPTSLRELDPTLPDRADSDCRARAGQTSRRPLPAHERHAPRAHPLPAATDRARLPGGGTLDAIGTAPAIRRADGPDAGGAGAGRLHANATACTRFGAGLHAR